MSSFCGRLASSSKFLETTILGIHMKSEQASVGYEQVMYIHKLVSTCMYCRYVVCTPHPIAASTHCRLPIAARISD